VCIWPEDEIFEYLPDWKDILSGGEVRSKTNEYGTILRTGAHMSRATSDIWYRGGLECWLLCLLTISMPFFGYSLVNFGTLPIGRPDYLAAMILVSVFFVSAFNDRRRIRVALMPVLILLFQAVTLNAVNYYFLAVFSLKEYLTVALQVVLGIAIFVAIPNLTLDRRQLRRVLKVWLVTASVISLYGIYQAFARNLGWPFAYLELNNPTYTSVTVGGYWGEFVRSSSVFVEPSYLGVYLVAPILLLVFTVRVGEDILLFFSRRVNLALLGCLLMALVLSFSKAAFLSLGLTLLLASLDIGIFKLVSTPFRIVLLVLVVFVVVVQALGVDVVSGVKATLLLPANPSAGSLTRRLGRQLIALEIWRDHPFLGVGLNQMRNYVLNYGFPAWYRDKGVFIASHNMWTNALAEMGVVGFIPLLLLWTMALTRIRIGYRRLSGTYSGVLLQAFFYVLVAEVISSMTTYIFANTMRWFHLSMAFLILSNRDRLGSFGPLSGRGAGRALSEEGERR